MDLHFEFSVARPQDEVFRFFSDPGNLEVVFAGHGPFRILRHHGNIEPGAQTWVEVGALLILPIVMGFEHDSLTPPDSFSEHLIHGPFKRFEHVHQFRGEGASTIICDTLAIELPWQYGGRAGMSMLVRRLITSMFRVRQLSLQRILNNPTSASS